LGINQTIDQIDIQEEKKRDFRQAVSPGCTVVPPTVPSLGGSVTVELLLAGTPKVPTFISL